LVAQLLIILFLGVFFASLTQKNDALYEIKVPLCRRLKANCAILLYQHYM
jgi:hypothetical protein